MRLLLTIASVILSVTVVAQTASHNKEYYQLKSKNQKTAGYILAAGGAALIISGIIVGNEKENTDPNQLDFGPNFQVGTWLVGGGIVAGLASIPFFIGSSNNARKAASLTLIRQRITIPHSNTSGLVFQPAVSLNIRF